MTSAKNPGGRPRKSGGPGRGHLGFQAPIHLRSQLEASATSNRRSLSAEAVARLEQSFLIERLIGSGLIDVMLDFDRSGSWRARELGIEGDWVSNPDCYKSAAMSAFLGLLESAPAPWDGKLWRTIFDNLLDRVEERAAARSQGGFVEPAEPAKRPAAA